MLCTNCKTNHATVFYRETINGKTTEYALCPDCAAKLDLNTSLSWQSAEDPFSSLFGSLLSHSRRAKEEKCCPTCGARFAELTKAGKLGCPACYDAFGEELLPTIRQLHGTASHRGRAPRRFGEKRQRENELARLRVEMKNAIETQAFEKAAELRDQIREIEGGK